LIFDFGIFDFGGKLGVSVSVPQTLPRRILDLRYIAFSRLQQVAVNSEQLPATSYQLSIIN